LTPQPDSYDAGIWVWAARRLILYDLLPAHPELVRNLKRASGMSQTFDLRPSIDAPPLVSPAGQRSGLPRGYVLTWVALAVGSLSYLTVLAVRTEDPATTAAVQRETPLMVAQGENRKLKSRLGEFQRDIAQLRGQMEVNGQDRSVIAALAAFEERFSTETGIAIAKSLPSSRTAMAPNVVSDPTSAPVAAALTATEVAQPAGVAGASVAVSPALVGSAPAGLSAAQSATVTPKVIARVDGPKIETGSIPAVPKPVAPSAPAAAPIAFGPAVVKAEPKPLGVQLGSALTLDALRLTWSLLAESNGDALKSLSPRYTASGTPEAGEVYDLVAGPVKSAADGKRICKALAARGVDCRVGPMGASAL
jgi:hypothetical protein